jgi:hypothetical protein
MCKANLMIQVQSGSDALHRIVCVCHRRVVQIVALSYADDEITLTIEGDEYHSRQIARWLDALHDVVAVRELVLPSRSTQEVALRCGVDDRLR